jgi:hypothetical protein
MNLHLTSIDPALDRLIRQTPEGMMFWAGTCADPAATCGGCVHYGYESVVRHKNTGDALRTSKHPHSCALFQQ